MRAALLPLCPLTLSSAGALGPRYGVVATGYTDGSPHAIPAGARFAVLVSPDAANPLLEEEIAAKLRRSLGRRGFRLVPTESAEVLVRLRYGSMRRLEQDDAIRVVPGVESLVKDSSGKVIGSAISPTTVATDPTLSITDTRWLTLTAISAGPGQGGASVRPLWIGETAVSRADLPFREAVDYLIGPAAEGFGENYQ